MPLFTATAQLNQLLGNLRSECLRAPNNHVLEECMQKMQSACDDLVVCISNQPAASGSQKAGHAVSALDSLPSMHDTLDRIVPHLKQHLTMLNEGSLSYEKLNSAIGKVEWVSIGLSRPQTTQATLPKRKK